MDQRQNESSLSGRLLFIVGTAAVSLFLMLVGSAVIGATQTRELSDIEQRLVPKLELRPRLEAEFEHMRQAMQDAVAAQDRAALDNSIENRNRIFDLIAAADGAMEASGAALLRWNVQDYYQSAHELSQQLIAGETGERLVDEMARMQAQQLKVSALIKQTTGLSRSELAESFAAIAAANRRADRFRFGVGLVGLALVLGLSVSAGRNILRALHSLSSGLSRFATGDFQHPVPTLGLRELNQLALEANRMAENLRQLAARRERDDWLKAGMATLSDGLRGEVEPGALAGRAVGILARKVGAVAGALYTTDNDALRLAGSYGQADVSECIAIAPNPSSSASGGLLIEASRAEGLMVLEDVPADFLRIQSGLGDGAARALLFLPLARGSESIGVLELALFKPCPSEVRELLESVSEMLAIALQASRSRKALREALQHAQAQTERLRTQEEELIANNQELVSQHEELRVANGELEAQRRALGMQNAELEQARARLQQKANELTKMSSYKSQFLANMSHELRTPLNSMLLLSHLLAENETGNLSSKQVEYSKTIHGAGGDLLNLINQVLDLAKIEAGRQDLSLETVEPARFLNYARRVFEPLAIEKGLELVLELGSDVPHAITTDPRRVERILTNLLGNAVKFTDRGRVALRIAMPDQAAKATSDRLDIGACLAYSVADTGIGIPPEAHERVFAPFEQIDSQSTRRYAGTGLGLAISRESAALLGGELQLASVPGQGSTFTCYLPIEAPVAARQGLGRQPSLSRRVSDDRELVGGAPYLLVIEDDTVLAEQLVDIIHAWHLQVVVAASGEEGIAMARKTKPQGIILDVTLPDVDGWTVMENLRAFPETRDVPVHFVSGVDSPERGLALGAVGYLLKPASHAELALAVRSLAPGMNGGPRRILVVEDSVLEGDSLCDVLRSASFEAVRVGSAKEALAALHAQRFHCMVLDLGLPDMDGLGVLETLRARGTSDAPRVIVHTGRSLNKRETQQLEAYAEAVVLKEGNSTARLLEEIRLFVSHVKDALSIQERSQLPPPLYTLDVTLKGLQLLIADDDMRTVYALSALLTSKGATVLIADTGREALERLGQNPDVDGVLMDIMMPEMDGYEATRRLRGDPRFSALPIIALTAKALKGERERCLEAGASDYLTKPIDTDKLLLSLSKLFQGRARRV